MNPNEAQFPPSEGQTPSPRQIEYTTSPRRRNYVPPTLQAQVEDEPPVAHLRFDPLDRGQAFMLRLSQGTFVVAFVALVWALIFPAPSASPEAQARAFGAAQAELSNPAAQTQPHQPAPLPPTPTPLKVGIVSGHAGYDPGAVCDDGLTEAEINAAVAEQVALLLTAHGVNVEILEEFDDRLKGYQADAVVSIHADSCNIPGATGFKVARSALSGIPQIEDRLVNCMVDEYGRISQLPEHPNSITNDMLHYHIFRDVQIETPAAIIELGFMLDDRYLLEYRPDLLAQGVAAGVMCFLESTSASTPSAGQ